MRPDMNKIIVERPRHGSRQRNYNSAQRLSNARVAEAVFDQDDFDSGPSRPPKSDDRKGLNENLAPLYRYLERQVGRPWTKVWGEILKGVDARSAIGLHILQHVPGFVETETFIEDGVVYYLSRGYVHRVSGLYVHPRSGLLRRAPEAPRVKKKEPQECIPVSDGVWFEKIDGIWYRFEGRWNNPLEWLPDRKCIAASLQDFELATVVKKHQCDSKTIRKIEAGVFGDPISKYRCAKETYA